MCGLRSSITQVRPLLLLKSRKSHALKGAGASRLLSVCAYQRLCCTVPAFLRPCCPPFVAAVIRSFVYPPATWTLCHPSGFGPFGSGLSLFLHHIPSPPSCFSSVLAANARAHTTQASACMRAHTVGPASCSTRGCGSKRQVWHEFFLGDSMRSYKGVLDEAHT